MNFLYSSSDGNAGCNSNHEFMYIIISIEAAHSLGLLFIYILFIFREGISSGSTL